MKISEATQNQRLDQFVTERLTNISRSGAAKLIESGKVSVNKVVSVKASYRLKQTDKVSIDDSNLKLAVPAITLPIIYEDDDCVVINKPFGVLTHSKGAFNPEPTVATWLQAHLLDEGLPAVAGSDTENDRAGIVHRLDRATSGVMICAKNPVAHAWLQKQFSQRKVKKTYIAIIAGSLENEHAIIDMPIERHPKHPQTFRVGINGKSAQTEYRVLETNEAYSLLELKPTTGRTHQLRVHLQHLKFPILGDSLYGKELPAERLYLHALRLELTLPSRDRKTFEAPLPDIFKKMMAA